MCNPMKSFTVSKDLNLQDYLIPVDTYTEPYLKKLQVHLFVYMCEVCVVCACVVYVCAYVCMFVSGCLC